MMMATTTAWQSTRGDEVAKGMLFVFITELFVKTPLPIM